MKSFFTHYSMQFGIGLGWDYTDYSKFAKENEEAYRKSECLTFGKDKLSITEWDVFQLSEASDVELSQNARAFKQYIVDLAMKNNKKPNEALMTSMHSGSSDYLLVSKVLATL